ncbi:hypothetical protein FKM82_002117 [Ascaphus truei]
MQQNGRRVTNKQIRLYTVFLTRTFTKETKQAISFSDNSGVLSTHPTQDKECVSHRGSVLPEPGRNDSPRIHLGFTQWINHRFQ